MTKLSKKHLDPERFGHYINNLWSAFILMDSKQDVRLLFKDLFTHTEYKMFAKRLEIARRLLGQQSYEQITKELNVTSRTISGINNILATAGEGLRLAHLKLNRLEEKFLKKQREIRKNFENPFLKKLRRKTLVGTSFKAGLTLLDEKISKSLKQRTAKRKLAI